jgi:hypothetical protein
MVGGEWRCEGGDLNPKLPMAIGWGWGSVAGGRVVLSLHARVSNHESHESGPRCSFLTTGLSRHSGLGVGLPQAVRRLVSDGVW